MARRAERELRLSEMAGISPGLKRLSDLWIRLDQAMLSPAPGASRLETWATEPWESKSPVVREVWQELTDPSQMDSLRAWIAQPRLNARALLLARTALAEAIRRSGR